MLKACQCRKKKIRFEVTSASFIITLLLSITLVLVNIFDTSDTWGHAAWSLLSFPVSFRYKSKNWSQDTIVQHAIIQKYKSYEQEYYYIIDITCYC